MFLISIRYTSRSRWRRVVQSLVTALQIRLPSGYLGTIQALSDFRTTLTNFSDNEGWPRYKGEYQNAIRPRLPGAYNVIVDQVNVIEKHQPSQFTPAGESVTDLIAQWNTCTTGEDRVNCPQYEYNYTGNGRPKKERFNPFVDLVHGQLKANSYAFSVDDAAGYQQQPGQGLIIAIGGASGLPNPQPVAAPPDFKKGDFVVNLGDSMPLHRPRWKSFGVCKDVADTDFPPLPPNATQDTPQFIVHSLEYNISQTNPCTDNCNRCQRPRVSIQGAETSTMARVYSCTPTGP